MCLVWQPGYSTSCSSFFLILIALSSCRIYSCYLVFLSLLHLFLLSSLISSVFLVTSIPILLSHPSPPSNPVVVLSSIFSSSCGGQRRYVKAWECVWIEEGGKKGAGWCETLCGYVWVSHHATPNFQARGKLCSVQKVIRD